MKNVEWYVYREDFNRGEIVKLNVFNHATFKRRVVELLKECDNRDDFSEELRRVTKYYYWSKDEYEVVITSWPPYISKGEIERLNNEDVKYRTHVNLEVGKKVDIYSQLELNWDRFVDYIWGFKK